MIKVGVIGLGIGERHVAALKQDSRVQVEVVCDLNYEKAALIAQKYDIDEYCSDWRDLLSKYKLDAVVVASYDHHHAEQINAFLLEKVHIFVEKPLCTTRDEFVSICERYALANQSSSVLMSTNFILRKEKRFEYLKSQIDHGKLGQIYSIESSYDYGRIHKILSGWRGTAPNYSVMNGGGIHVIDLCQWLMGDKFEPLFALHNKVSTSQSSFLAPDYTSAMGRIGQNTIMKVTANFGSQTPHFHQLKIYGTKGTFINDCAVGTYYFGNEPDVIKVADEYEFPCANKGDLLPNFIDAINGQDELDVSFEELAAVMDVSLAIDQLANEKN